MLQSTDSVTCTLFTKVSLVLQLNIEFCAQWWFFIWWKFNYHFVAPGNSWICVLFTRTHGRIKDFAQIFSVKFEPKPLCLETDVHSVFFFFCYVLCDFVVVLFFSVSTCPKFTYIYCSILFSATSKGNERGLCHAAFQALICY